MAAPQPLWRTFLQTLECSIKRGVILTYLLTALTILTLTIPTLQHRCLTAAFSIPLNTNGLAAMLKPPYFGTTVAPTL